MIHNGVIFSPKEQQKYIVQLPNSPTKTIVKINGCLPKLVYFSAHSFSYGLENPYSANKKTSSNILTHHYNTSNLMITTHEVMPFYLEYPVGIYQISKPATGEGLEVANLTKLSINFNTNQYSRESQFVERLYPHNQFFKEYLTKNFFISADAPGLPIFIQSDKQPTAEYLRQVYQKFMAWNKERIKEQNELTVDYCHFRSHVISQILYWHGIYTLKVVKYYNNKEWKQFPENNRKWTKHYATLILDRGGKMWVFDPWVCDEGLVSLYNWIHRPNEPTAIHLNIYNHNIFDDVNDGLLAVGNIFEDPSLSPEYANIFSALFSSMLPNKPISPLNTNEENEPEVLIEQQTAEANKNPYCFFHTKLIAASRFPKLFEDDISEPTTPSLE